MGSFYSFWSVAGSIAVKAINFGATVVKPILNGITSISNIVKEVSLGLSMVPIIGAAASQVAAAANIVSSVSSAGVEIIGVGERLVGKHVTPEPVVSASPMFAAATEATLPSNAPTSFGATLPSNMSQAAPSFINVLPMSSFSAAAPLIAPIIPKNAVQERRFLRVIRPSARGRYNMYRKDEVDDLTERMSYLNISNNVAKPLRVRV